SAQIDLPITFDDPAVTYEFTDFGGGGPTTLAEDPTDAANTVARTVRGAGAVVFAGVTMTDPTGLATPIPFTESNTTMTVRVYSPDAGVPVRLKVEDNADPTRSVETQVVTTEANSWETLTFDFSNQATGTAELNLSYTYDKVTIFFDFGTDGAPAGEKVYLWDDVEFGGSGGGATAYTDQPVDTWRADYSAGTLEEIQIAGNDTKKYSVLDFAGIEFVGPNSVDATGMTHFRMDVWTPDATLFGVKLVDFGEDNAFGGGDDSEHQLDFTASSTPALGQGSWITLDIPLAQFEGLASTANLSQIIVVGQPTGASTFFVDNVFFYNSDTPPPTEPTTAAPAPTVPAADVISMFSDAYDDVPVDTWRTEWSQAGFEDVQTPPPSASSWWTSGPTAPSAPVTTSSTRSPSPPTPPRPSGPGPGSTSTSLSATSPASPPVPTSGSSSSPVIPTPSSSTTSSSTPTSRPREARSAFPSPSTTGR
ncbi:MAG: hypothetical protein P8188_02495, partial [Gemmatimonadota bacterium]